MSPMTVKRVAVIGAGVAGLVSVKCCLECGLEAVCFERNDKIGGVWQIHELESFEGVQGSTMYKSLITNTSKEMMAFSDFPFPKEYPPYMFPKHVIQYYRDYVRHFGLDRHIRLATEVVRVAPSVNHDATGRWEVTSRPRCHQDILGDLECEAVLETFDAVIVCSGFFSSAVMPQYPGQNDFQGQILHSNKFWSGEQFEGKTVLVVGASHSAADVAVDTSRNADQVYLSMHEGGWVFSRYGPGGVPADAFANSRFMSKTPEFVTTKLTKWMNEGHFNFDNLGLRGKRGPFNGSAMINDEIQNRIICGALQCKPGIDYFTPGGVVFQDGTCVDKLDAVIFATGYDFKFPFFEDNSIIADNCADLELYKLVWPARRIHPTLAAVGYVIVPGGVGPVMELQARWVTQVLLGNVRLPGIQKRLEEVKRRKDECFRRFGKHRIFCFAVPYSEDLADEIGVRPNFTKLLLKDPSLAFHCFFGPAYPPTYRLNGPHPWKGAREAIMNGWDNTVYPTKTRTVDTQPLQEGVLSLFGSIGWAVGIVVAIVFTCLFLVLNSS